MTGRDWGPSTVIALAAAAILLAAGVLMAVYQEKLYSDQQVKSVREQAQILATSATAAILFGDHSAAQEYVDALRANPELLGAAIYGVNGRQMAGFARGTQLPERLTSARVDPGRGYIDVVEPAGSKGARAGWVLLRAATEPLERRFVRNAGLILQAFVQKYGAAILAAPTTTGFNRVAWIMPFLVLAAGFGLAVTLVRNWRSEAPAATGLSAVGEDFRARVRKETEL